MSKQQEVDDAAETDGKRANEQDSEEEPALKRLKQQTETKNHHQNPLNDDSDDSSSNGPPLRKRKSRSDGQRDALPNSSSLGDKSSSSQQQRDSRVDTIPKKKTNDTTTASALLSNLTPAPTTTNTTTTRRSPAGPSSRPKQGPSSVPQAVRRSPPPTGTAAAPRPAFASKSSGLERLVLEDLSRLCDHYAQDVHFSVLLPSTKGGIDFSGSFLAQGDAPEFDFFDTNQQGEIVLQPKPPMFPEDFSQGMREHSLGWWGILDPALGDGKFRPELQQQQQQQQTQEFVHPAAAAAAAAVESYTNTGPPTNAMYYPPGQPQSRPNGHRPQQPPDQYNANPTAPYGNRGGPPPRNYNDRHGFGDNRPSGYYGRR